MNSETAHFAVADAAGYLRRWVNLNEAAGLRRNFVLQAGDVTSASSKTPKLQAGKITSATWPPLQSRGACIQMIFLHLSVHVLTSGT